MHDRADSTRGEALPFPETLGRRVRARRRAIGLTQEELAELARTSVRFLVSLEHGKVSVRLDKVLAVLEALGLELAMVRRGHG